MMNGLGCGSWGIAGMGLGGLSGFLTLIAVLALAGLGGAWLARRGKTPHNVTDSANGGDTHAVRGDAARDRLRQRYAEGEMDEEEFERRLAALTWR
jgi:uncharacterized membrane protein